MKNVIRSAIAMIAIVILFTTEVRAGGPLALAGPDGTTPVTYYKSSGAVEFHMDTGTLDGSWTNSQADQIVANAATKWNEIATSTVKITLGPNLSPQLTASNFLVESERQITEFGRSHIVYDENGDIVNLLFGSNSHKSVLGLGASYVDNDPAAFVGGFLVLNGWLNLSKAAYEAVAMHEIGHVMGLDHTQLDDSQGLLWSEYPIMYPFLDTSNPRVEWHEDDLSIISRLYPSASFADDYILIHGYLQDTAGNPVRGANVWVDEQSEGSLYSSVSDFRTANDGYFLMAVAPGNYTLHAEPIQADHTGGSSVGPYAETSGDISFQDPIASQDAENASFSLLVLTPSASCTPRVTFVVDGASSWHCNKPPNAEVSIKPSAPTDRDDLVLSYSFDDFENDPIVEVDFHWYRNGIHEAKFDGELRVSYADTASGETWEAVVIPSDGSTIGMPVRSNTVTIAASSVAGGSIPEGFTHVTTSKSKSQKLESDKCGCATGGGTAIPGDALLILATLGAAAYRRRRHSL